MIPTREQFKEFMAYVQHAQEKEDKVNDAFELIWDEEQAQHVPFYISPWWKVVRYAFCLLFNLKFNKLGIDDVLGWWMEEAPKGEAKYWIDEKEYNVSDIDAFYDYLVDLAKDLNRSNDGRRTERQSDNRQSGRLFETARGAHETHPRHGRRRIYPIGR